MKNIENRQNVEKLRKNHQKCQKTGEELSKISKNFK